MRTHLSAVDGVFLAHGFLDEGVAGLGGQGLAAKAGYELFRVPGEARVVNDPPWFWLRKASASMPTT